VVEELIPEMSEGKHSNAATIAFSVGFVLMMILDVALGWGSSRGRFMVTSPARCRDAVWDV